MKRASMKMWIGGLSVGAGLVLGACSGEDTQGSVVGSAGSGSAGSGSAGSGSAGSGSAGSGGQGAANGNLPQFVPMFPGAGSSVDATAPLAGGMLCDYVPKAGENGVVPVTQCFFAAGQTLPAATMEQVLECVEGQDAVHVRLTFDPSFVDNTYGSNSVGWPPKKKKMMVTAGHTFKDLVGSDHAEIQLTDGNGDVAVQFKLDYITEDPTAPSGYSCLGVTGGEGAMIVGDESSVVAWNSSFSRNLNERGYGSYTTDSPATDADYTANAATPDWDYRVVYEAWVDVDAFDGAGFGGASIEFVHASPSKGENNTIEVEPGECPPDWRPGCTDLADCPYPPSEDCVPSGPDDTHCLDGGVPAEPPTGEPCVPSGPDDTHCLDGGVTTDPPSADPIYCMTHPADPACTPD